MGLTGVSLETMRPSGPVKLESIESGMYKEVGLIVAHVLEFRLKKANSSLFIGQVSLKYSVCPRKVLDVFSFSDLVGAQLAWFLAHQANENVKENLLVLEEGMEL